ncbi:MAG: hypothetical protein AAFX52_08430 [Pseudomonadota bacterium]
MISIVKSAVGILVFALCVLSSSASADMWHRADLKNVVQLSDIGIIGRPVSSETKMVDQRVTTETTFAVSETLFGRDQATVTVVTPGGIYMGGPVPFAVDMGSVLPLHTDGDSVLLLTETDSSLYELASFGEGFFPIRGEGNDAEVVVEGSTSPVSVTRFIETIRNYR